MNTTNPSVSPGAAAESTVWQGTPSQVINLPQYLLWGLIFVILVAGGVIILQSTEPAPTAGIIAVCLIAAIPLVIIIWKWLVVATTQYELTTQRLRMRRGVFNKHLDELELYRVRDY